MPWKDYETKGFWNREDVTRRMADRIKIMHPEFSPEKVNSEAVFSTEMHFQEIKSERKNKKSFAFLDVPLPDNTQWGDIKIIFLWYNKDFKQSKVHIYVKGVIRKKTNLHEMGLENTVEDKPSVSWKILFLMSIWSRFVWEGEGRIPLKYTKEKERLADDLKKFFWLNSDPFIEENREYKLEINLSVSQKSLLQSRYPKFTEKTVFELLEEKSIF